MPKSSFTSYREIAEAKGKNEREWSAYWGKMPLKGVALVTMAFNWAHRHFEGYEGMDRDHVIQDYATRFIESYTQAPPSEEAIA